MTVDRREPSAAEPHLRLVASDGQGVQRPQRAPAAPQAATLDEVALAIVDVCSMPVDEALEVLERARQSIPGELAAVRSIFATLDAFTAAGA